MGRKKNRYGNRQSGTPAVAENPGSPAIGRGAAPMEAMFSGYAGANFSKRRASVRWPTLDTRHELNGFARSELVRRVRWLYANVGLAKRLIKGLAEMVGYLSPQPKTSDTEWNKLMLADFNNSCGSKEVFDHSGKFDFYTAQPLLTRSWLRDGDMLTVMTESKAGRAMFAFFEGHQLQSPSKGEGNWREGVLTNDSGRHLAYGLARDSGEPLMVSAKNAIYFGEFDSVGHGRAVPPLAHAVNHVVDITEIWADVKGAIKVNSLSGVVRTQKDAAGEYRGAQGLVGAVKKKPDGNGGTMRTEEVWGGSQIPRLAPGEDLKVISDPRPEQNQRDQIMDLIRDISWGTGLPPEVIWHMAGLSGPGVRFILELADRWIKSRQDYLEDWCRLVWVRHCALAMKNGRVRKCKDPEWWRCEYRPQKSMTIDRGRDGKQRREEMDSGMGTWEDWFTETDGADWQDKIQQRVNEIKKAREMCEEAGLKYEDVFPPKQGAAAKAGEAEAKAPDDQADE